MDEDGWARYPGLAFAGFLIGCATLAFFWFPNDALAWFLASLIPAFIGFRYPHSPGGSVFLGLWAALFWVPLLVAGLKAVGILH